MANINDLFNTRLVVSSLPHFNSAVSSAADVIRMNPAVGLGSMIDLGLATRPFLDPSSLVANSVHHPLTAYSSLATLAPAAVASASTPTVHAAASFAGTLDGLTAVSALSSSFGNVLSSGALLSSGSSANAVTGSLASAAFGVGLADAYSVAGTIARPYIASASAVYAYESSISRLTAGTLAAEIGRAAAPDYVDVLQRGVIAMSSSLNQAWNYLSRNPSVMAATPAHLLRWPAVEMYTAAQTATVLTSPDDAPVSDDELEGILSDNIDGFESRLAAVNQDLVGLYRGGMNALERGGPDWQRQSMASFRELCMHVLHLLAPNAEVMSIATSDDLHDGRPTRKARLRFIFAAVSGNDIADFFEADLKAAVALFDALNSGTHRLEASATPAQLHYLRGRIVGLIASMLEARGY